METKLLRDIVLRPPEEGDAPLVADLLAASNQAAAGITAEDVRYEWRSECFSLQTDAVIVRAPGGEVVGYAALRNRGQYVRLVGVGGVHPAYRGRGIGTALLRWGENWAHARLGLAPPGLVVTLDYGLVGTDAAAARLFAQASYARVRTFWTMHIALDGPPPRPVWPDGLVVRPFVPGQDEYAAYGAAEEAFRDHWGHVSVPFAEWHASRLAHADFDPSLLLLAWDGAVVAGAVRCRERAGRGWIESLAVRRPWRGRGLGRALLLQAFGALSARGVCAVGLEVDTANPTGAPSLYARAGMRVVRHSDVYRKTVRDGAEPAP
jgi:mycothiol synthase